MPPKFSKELNHPVLMHTGPETQARTSPCEAHCPAGNPIQKVHALIQNGNPEEALTYLRSRNPFPGVTGRICGHFCETRCNRRELDQGVSIKALERYAADCADRSRTGRPERRTPSGKKLAIVGAGPSGMACAYFSALLGHDVTVFEASAVLGGMPRIGVPDFRLPKWVVDREIGHILETGVRAVTNTKVGRDVSFERLRKEYDACLIAIGTWKEKTPDIEGADRIQPGVSFLKKVNLGQTEAVGKVVAVLGGGGVAFDCAFAARRLGADEVHIFCVEDEDNTCALAEDIVQAERENISIHYSRLVTKIAGEDHGPEVIEFCEISSFSFDECGRLDVCPTPDGKKIMTVDRVISAIGLEPDLQFEEKGQRPELTHKGLVSVDPATMKTSMQGVFAAGDVVHGPSSIACAIGSGRNAAMSIHRFLTDSSSESSFQNFAIRSGGEMETVGNSSPEQPHVVSFEEIYNIQYHEKRERCLPEGGSSPFADVAAEILDGSSAISEAERCLHCGHCISCGTCVTDCPGFVLEMTDAGPRVEHFDECWHCGCCRIACPTGSVYYEFPLHMMV